MSTIECASCRSIVPAASRFCPECGRPLVAAAADAEGDARRFWPPEWTLVPVVLLGAAGIVLLAAQVWVWGFLLLAAAAAAYLFQREVERRATRRMLGGMRARIAAHKDLVSARSRGQIELFRMRRELAELQAARSRGYHELGRATYEQDPAAAAAAHAHVDDVSKRIAEREEEVSGLLREMQERVHSIQAQAAPTRRLEAPPEPARVPEPYPPPDEGTPPEPARVPEPMPEPVPEPTPEPVPEPSPDDPPPEPEHPPTPQTRRRRASSAKRS